MRTGAALSVLFLLSVGVSTPADDTKKANGKPAAFEQFKQLAGDWEGTMSEGGKEGKGEKVTSSYKVTAGGSAVVETIAPGSAHEMITVIHPDGDSILLTHYCMLGNQPRMKASTKSLGNKLNFEFAGGSNFDPKKDKHMHAATLTIIDADHLQVDGIGWENGEPAKEMCNGMKLVRKK